MCLAQGHNAVPPVRLEPAIPRSKVKHSTTEPLGSLALNDNFYNTVPILTKLHKNALKATFYKNS